MTDQETHFLEWRRFRMACHKKPNEVYTSTSFWDQTTCPQCLQHRPAGDDQQAEQLLDGEDVA